MKIKKTNIKKSCMQYFFSETTFFATKILSCTGIKKNRSQSKLIRPFPISRIKSACLFSGRRTGLLKNLHVSRFFAKKFIYDGNIPGIYYSGR